MTNTIASETRHAVAQSTQRSDKDTKENTVEIDDSPSRNDIDMVLQMNTCVSTAYGDGKIVGYNTESCHYKVRLSFGTLYAVQDSLWRRNPGVQLTAAYDALEKMRQLNLEVTCHELGLMCQHDVCTMCLLDSAKNKAEQTRQGKTSWKLSKRQLPNKNVPPCLICGSPTCTKHQSRDFSKQHIVLCTQCEELFDLNFEQLVKQETEEDQDNDLFVPHKVRTLVDTYDRVMLLLTHASLSIHDLVIRSTSMERHNNRIGLGTSGAGIVSGALGLAGAATIFTPMGPPLLLASLAISGSSAAVTVGNSAMHYFSTDKPAQAANRIIVLHSIASSLLTAAQSLQHVAATQMPTPHTNGKDTPEQGVSSIAKEEDNNMNQQLIAETVGQGLQIVRQADTGLNLANAAATSSVYVSTAAPAATNLVQSSANMLAAVPVLGTALAGIFIAMDANRLQSTLQKIKAGDPSEKADALVAMQSDLLLFPQTADLDAECQAYCQVILNQASKQP